MKSNKTHYVFDIKKVLQGGPSFTEVWCVIIKDSENVIDRTVFYVQDTVSGCGLSIIRNLLLDSDEKAIVFGDALKQLFSSTVAGGLRRGAILATLGESYWDRYHKRVLLMGFKEIHNFPNPVHGGAKQRIYALNF